ncbi:MAG: GIY-YIG nuclease family protein [Candidatus Aureabacteria bacterium]|nr:GIY-YIG nuclease family protein [Candidatus Auribacterota bacterium]
MNRANKRWQVYIIQCKDGTLYTGVTNNLAHRIDAHNCGKGCRYTKCRRPVKLLHAASFPDKSAAMRREAEIKKWSRREKEEFLGKK